MGRMVVTEKRLYIWNEVLDKANSDCDGNRKEFVGRTKAFDEDWKQEVESKVRECCNMSNACEDSVLDRPVEIARCLKSNKTGGSDGLVGELLKYGWSGMVNLLHQLFSVRWHVENPHRGERDL